MLKKMLIGLLIVISLPILFLMGLKLYGHWMVYQKESKQEALIQRQEIASQAGNGFGGERGMYIQDSKQYSESFFWIDNENLAFVIRLDRAGGEGRNFVWDVESNKVKPIDISGGIGCIKGNDLYYAQWSEEKLLNGSKEANWFRSSLKEENDKWSANHPVNVLDIWQAKDSRYEFQGIINCTPRFYLPNQKRVDQDVPRHSYKIMPEWNWVYRFPRSGLDYIRQSEPEMGFIDIGESVYQDQAGVKIADLPSFNPKAYIKIEPVYLSFLDKYWLANRLSGYAEGKKYLAFINRNGDFSAFAWDEAWPKYRYIPIPTKKGMFWSGMDYRLDNPDYENEGAYIRDAENIVHKVIHGLTERHKISPDGCKVAFSNSTKVSEYKSSLKIFNACLSKKNGKELNDVNYNY